MKQFLVALYEGGLPEMEGHVRYTKPKIVEAEYAEQAKTAYDKIVNEHFWASTVLAEVVSGKVTVPVSIFLQGALK